MVAIVIFDVDDDYVDDVDDDRHCAVKCMMSLLMMISCSITNCPATDVAAEYLTSITTLKLTSLVRCCNGHSYVDTLYSNHASNTDTLFSDNSSYDDYLTRTVTHRIVTITRILTSIIH